jgi:regulation of enolase protein 1 (concanavalin A-like superfamily)
VSASGTTRAGVPPAWVRLQRSGNTFAASMSADGTTWTPLGTATISMAADVFVGLAVTSHDSSTTATGRFDDVVVEP